MLQRAPNTQHTAQSTACCLDSLEARDNSRSPFIDTNSTLLPSTCQRPLYLDFGFLWRMSLYFHDLTLIVTRVTLTSIRHLWHLLIVTLPRIPYAHSVYVLSQQLFSKSYVTQKTHMICFNVCQEHIGNNRPIRGFSLVFYPPTPLPKVAYFAPPFRLLPLEEPERKVDWRDTTTPAPIWLQPITALLMWWDWWFSTDGTGGGGGNWWDTTTPTLLGFWTTTALWTWRGWSGVTGSADRGSGNTLSRTAVEARLGTLSPRIEHWWVSLKHMYQVWDIL